MIPRAHRLLAPVRHPASAAEPSRHPSARPVPTWVELLAGELDHRVDPPALAAALRAGGIVATTVAAVLLGVLPAVGVAGVCLVAPRAALPTLERRRSARRDTQLAGALERVAGSVRSGSSIAAALHDLAAEQPEPLGRELRHLDASVRHGVALGDALEAWTARSASPEVTLAAAALSLGAQAGGPVARSLDGVAATLRERRQLQAEVRALATQARASAWLLAVAPVGFAALMSTVEPRAVGFLVGTPVGIACLAAGLLLDVVGAVWMARVVRQAG